jgi:hypothetical protein
MSISCPSESDAHLAFETYARSWDAASVLGDEAAVGRSLPTARNDVVGWRQDTGTGILLLGGAASDKRITATLAELLAHRVVARS